jgi:opacity protein-like surface antigen
MKTWKIAVPAVLACALAVSSVNAATTAAPSNGNPFTFALQGGIGIPNGDFSGTPSATSPDKLGASNGWNIAGQGDWWMNPTWGFGVDLGYHSNSVKDEAKALNGLDQVNTFTYGAHAIYEIPMQGQFHPYAQAGLGMGNVSAKPVTGSSTSENKFAWNLGAGVDFHANPMMSFGINALYNDVQTSTALNWVDVNARVTFHMASK